MSIDTRKTNNQHSWVKKIIFIHFSKSESLGQKIITILCKLRDQKYFNPHSVCFTPSKNIYIYFDIQNYF